MSRRNLSGLFLIVVLVLLLVAQAQAAEFSAITVTKAGSREQQGKLFVKGDKARMEGVTPLGPCVTILRLDKKVMWLMMPGQKAYMEMPVDKEAFAQALNIPEEGVSKRFIGTETLHGYDTEKYETTVKVGDHEIKSIMWIAKNLEIPVRIESADKSFVQDYDIKEGQVDDALFEMPASYQKMSLPAGMPKMK